MDPRLDQNESELRVLVFSVPFEVFPDSDGLHQSGSADVQAYSQKESG